MVSIQEKGYLQNLTTFDDFYEDIPWEEEIITGIFRRWHIIFLSTGSCLAAIIFFCCVLKCRVPRTKQEIEADFIRRKLARKFHQQLQIIKNSEMDEMDLIKALERLRNELKADTVSLAQSEAFSALSFTPTGTPTYRKGSEVNIGLSLNDFNIEEATGINSKSMKTKITDALSSTLFKLRK